MLEHLEHFEVGSLEEVIPLIAYEFRVFHFPPAKASKPALYGRMNRIRELGIDAMVREVNGEYVLISRREYPRG